MKERKKIFTRDNFEVGILVTFFLVSIIALTPNVNADEIKFGFKNALWNCLFFVTMLFVISGIGTPVLGALVRYKVPGLLFLIISINLIYDQLYKGSIN